MRERREVREKEGGFNDGGYHFRSPRRKSRDGHASNPRHLRTIWTVDLCCMDDRKRCRWRKEQVVMPQEHRWTRGHEILVRRHARFWKFEPRQKVVSSASPPQRSGIRVPQKVVVVVGGTHIRMRVDLLTLVKPFVVT